MMVDFDLLGKCVVWYEVLFIVVVFKWINFMEEKVVLISYNDGFINWVWLSLFVCEVGVFFKMS